MEIYVDVYLAENIIINLFLLLLTFKLLRYEYDKWIIYVSAILGGIYGLVIFTDINILNSHMFKVLVPVLMICFALKQKKCKKIIIGTIVYFMMAFMLGGICFGSLQMQNTYLLGEEFTIKDNSIKYIVFSLAIIFIVAIRVADTIRERALIKNFLYDIYITEGERTVLVKGFLDTGNELREPVTNLPCIIIERSYFNQFNISDDKKFIIKYDTINEIGEIKGFKVRDIMIRNDDSNYWFKVDAIVCGCERKLSKEDEFQALLSRGIV